MDGSHSSISRKEQEKAEREKEERRRFSRELYSQTRVNELRKKHQSGKLSPEESLNLILHGNVEHIEAIEKEGASVKERYQKISAGAADYLVIACSDARIPRLDSEGDKLVGLQVRIAGNVVPKKGTPSFEEISEAVSMVKPDGLILIEGHCNCGACKERVKWVESGMPDTGSKELNNLLHEVFGSNPEENAIAQITKARETIHTGDRTTGAVVYDWEKGGIHIVSANHSPIMEILVDNWNRRHIEAFEEGKLKERLSSHKPHAIAVGTSDLPFSLATISHARQNEIFSTTGSERGLDELDKASILYAIEHLGVRHIPFIAPGTEKDERKIKAMFDRWESELEGMSVHGHKVVKELIEKKELKVSWLRYDLESGELRQLK